MNKTKIEWCDSTLNPVVGCTYGCEFCYARKMNSRFGWVKDFNVPQFFNERLEKLNSKSPKNIFMDSMSDIADWKGVWMANILNAISRNPQHNYLFLSKRPEDAYCWSQFEDGNMWCGVTAINQTTADTALKFIHDLNNRNVFLSIEPLLGEINLSREIENVNWVIIGAETGNRKGKVAPKAEWVKVIVLECDKYSIPVFMKESLLPVVGESNMRREFPEGLKRS